MLRIPRPIHPQNMSHDEKSVNPMIGKGEESSAEARKRPDVTNEIDSTRENNNIVAESDYNAVLTLLEERVQQSAQDDSDRAASLLKQKVFESMIYLLTRVTRPVSDEAFHKYCLDMENHRNKSTDSVMKDVDESSPTPIEFEMKDFDDDELLDTYAIDRVHDLRQKVRDQARQVAKVRDEVLTIATSTTKQHMDRLRATRKTSSPSEEEPEENMTEAADAEEIAVVNSMQSALQRTKKQLVAAERKLPVLLDKWQRQMETLKENEAWNLSQTEQILRTTTKDTILPESASATAEDRFMRFLG